MTKMKMSALGVVAGAALLMSIGWLLEDKLFYWSWWIVAVLCGFIIAISESATILWKVKVTVPSLLLGAALVMTIGSMYYGYQNYLNSGGEIDFPMFVIWGGISGLFITIVRMIKLYPPK